MKYKKKKRIKHPPKKNLNKLTNNPNEQGKETDLSICQDLSKDLYIASFRQWYSQWKLDYQNKIEATKSDSHAYEHFIYDRALTP